jgi:predicted Zn-dependent protease
MTATGDTAGAREALRKADTLLDALPPATPMRAPLLSNLARAWAGAGDARRARALLSQAERSVTGELRIDQPGFWANLAASYGAIGNEPEKQRLLDRAIGSANGLENARPRALAVVTICRALGRHGIDPDDAARTRLDALYDGLKAPW